MKKKVALFWISQALFLGAVMGWGMSYFYYSFSRATIVGTAATETGYTVATLTRYRMGKETNVVELLEGHLDMELVHLDTLFAEYPASIRDPGCRVILKSAKDYRDRFPHKAKTPKIDLATARVFALLDGRNGD